MFSNIQSFQAWLGENSAPELKKLLSKLKEEELAQLHTIYEEACDVQGDYTRYMIMKKLGGAIGSLIMHVASTEKIKEGAKKKSFVIENLVNISRLIDNGISGDEDNIHRGVKSFETLGETATSLQDDFVRPMVDQAIETFWNSKPVNVIGE